MSNTFGHLFRLTTFGESHGEAIGGVIDGMPAGIDIDMDFIQQELNRRRPGQSVLTTSRQEADKVELLSGVFEGKSTGTPIGFLVRNTNQHSNDYDNLRDVFRPSHADFTYYIKYGIRDHRGGGRASARETACRVVAGALAKQALITMGININAKALPPSIEKNTATGDTQGGIVECVITGVPTGVGEPVFGKLSAQLAEAMMSIPAAKGFELGLGFDFVNHPGSEVLDNWVVKDGNITTETNFSGGIQGGISNGNDIYFKVAFKPVATLPQTVKGINADGNIVTIEPRGRHDTCVVKRAIPVVEAMAAIVMLDNVLMARASRW